MFSDDALPALNQAVGKLNFLVKGDVRNLAQAAMRFVLSHPAVSAVIPGIRTVQQVEDNAAASGKPLPEADVSRLRQLYKSDFRSIAFH
jgi:aryl-alcohol dehydrogenase-like predicted oxidoreductase